MASFVMTGRELSKICTPWQGGATHIRPGCMTGNPMAVDTARWQGEPVAVAVATNRAVAEDAAEIIDIEWELAAVSTAGFAVRYAVAGSPRGCR